MLLEIFFLSGAMALAACRADDRTSGRGGAIWASVMRLAAVSAALFLRDGCDPVTPGRALPLARDRRRRLRRSEQSWGYAAPLPLFLFLFHSRKSAQLRLTP
jgi:hypothetical protein